MLSISDPVHGVGNLDYYLKLAREDYYLEGGEPPGRWAGMGAQLLRLPSFIDRSVLKALISGFAPDGKTALVQNAGDEDRQSYWDLTLSAPKSVSVLWAVSEPHIRHKIQELHYKAVIRTLSEIERGLLFSRRGKGGKDVEPAACIFATFEHGTSRAQDPNIHTHTLLLNLGFREDGTTGSILSKPFFEKKLELGARYQAQFAALVQRGLGLRVHYTKDGFELSGVPREVCDEFSKRSKEIGALLDKWGDSSAVAAKKANLLTRQRKKSLPRATLFEAWTEVAKAQGFTQAMAKKLLHEVEDVPFAEVRRQTGTKKKRPRKRTRKKHEAHKALPLGGPGRKRRRPAEEEEEEKDKPKSPGSEASQETQQTEKPSQNRNEKRSEARARAKKAQMRARAFNWKVADAFHNIMAAVATVKAGENLLRIEAKYIFPNAPKWHPFANWKLPRLVLNIEERERLRWGEKHATLETPLGDIELRDRFLFPDAPIKSLRKSKIKAIRTDSRAQKREREKLRAMREEEKSRTQSQSRTHSYGH